ncbi:response regulator [Paenibacillus psychroresistens]|uniref:response regulator n=1 Tax=Paenibacillus psychroresistens TaxID=1778678 RepID=UPI001390DCC5|nr:response regulator [Paenibacillus psychroresistens]
MYDVLIVEDEPIARESLKYLIDWQEYGFAIKAEAEDGQQALEMMKSHYYALVVTDIRMPTMNGLEFIKELRLFSDAAVIILSGYDDFEYARQGMKMGVQDYLLKPLDEEDLINILQRLQQEIAQKHRKHRQLHLGLTALRDQFLKKLAHNQIKKNEYSDQLKLLEMHTSFESICCLLVEMDFFHPLDANWTGQEIELKRFAIRNIIEEICGRSGYVFEVSEERYGIVYIGTDDELDDEFMMEWAGELAEAVRLYAKETVSIGLGQTVSQIQDAHQSFHSAEAALDGKFLMGNNAVLKSITPIMNNIEQKQLLNLEEEVLAAIKSYHREHVSKALLQLWDGFKTKQAPANKVKTTVLEILVQLMHLVKNTGANHAELFDHELGDYERVMKIKTLEELFQFIERKCFAVLDLLHKTKDFQPNKIIETMKKIVQEQYPTNLSLRVVAQQVFMNPVYLGQLFKANVDCSFNDYLLQVRMDKAKHLLTHSDKKVYEIAQEVGFGELDWFYKRFKLYTGFSASEYRAST